MSMLKALRATQPEAPINIVNGDVQVVELIQGAGDVLARTNVITDTTPRQGPRPKFKPVERVGMGNGSPIVFESVDAEAPPSDNMDLVGDIIDDIDSPPPKRNARGGGRKRIYATNAERQKALRERKKQKANG